MVKIVSNQEQVNSLIADIHTVFPGLSGDLYDQQDSVVLLDRAPAICHISALYQALQVEHPEGGRIFWSSRIWNLLIWQAVYVSILSVQLLNKTPGLEGFGVSIRGIKVDSYTLSTPSIYYGRHEDLLRFSGNQMRRLNDIIYHSVNRIVPLSFKLAQRLETDCIVSALLFQNTIAAKAKQKVIEELIAQWLVATGLPEKRGTFSLPQANDSIGLDFGFKRQVCCQEFRLLGRQRCDTCPSIPLADREKRITSVLSHTECTT